MKKFSEWLEDKDPEVYNEILGTLALATGIAGAIAPQATGRAVKYVAKKAVDIGANVAGHVLKKGIDLTGDAIKGGVNLAGKGIYHGSKLAAKGIKSAISKKEVPPTTTKPESGAGGTWYA
jgi:hypothetical protein